MLESWQGPTKTVASKVLRMWKGYEIKGNLGCDSRHSPFLEAETLMCEFDFICGDIPATVLTKGKAIPLQPWTGPEGSSRLRLPDFMTVGT